MEYEIVARDGLVIQGLGFGSVSAALLHRWTQRPRTIAELAAQGDVSRVHLYMAALARYGRLAAPETFSHSADYRKYADGRLSTVLDHFGFRTQVITPSRGRKEAGGVAITALPAYREAGADAVLGQAAPFMQDTVVKTRGPNGVRILAIVNGRFTVQARTPTLMQRGLVAGVGSSKGVG
jgi:hypothetical protein